MKWKLWIAIVICIDGILFLCCPTTDNDILDTIMGLVLAIIVVIFCHWNFKESNCQIFIIKERGWTISEYSGYDKINRL